MRKATLMNLLKSFDELFKVEAGNRFLKATSLAENDKQIGLICWEHKVCVRQTFKGNVAAVKALNDVLVANHVKYLSLVLCFIYLRLLSLVEFAEDSDILIRGVLALPKTSE